MDTDDASGRVAVLLAERGVTPESVAGAAGLDAERLRSVLHGEDVFALQEVLDLAAALEVDARFLAFGDADVFAMRAGDSDVVGLAQDQCRRALDSLLGLEALVG